MQKIHNPNELITLKEIQNKYDENDNYLTEDLIKNIDLMIKSSQDVHKELIKILKKRLIINNIETTVLDGLIFRKLIEKKNHHINLELNTLFPKGIINLKSSLKTDYQPLQELLINKEFQEADQLTQALLCKLTPLNKNNKRKWLYFTDIPLIPSNDLFIIDLLWKVYSNGKFGFSIQRKIWQKQNYDWDKFLDKVGWVKCGIMKRYPQEFAWTINAPQGHLPLFNQLRGKQVIYYLFKHIAWLQ